MGQKDELSQFHDRAQAKVEAELAGVKAKHTAEPWKIIDGNVYGPGSKMVTFEHAGKTITRRDRLIALVYNNSDNGTSPFHEANTERIVACVNYCAGMTAEQLTCDSAQIVREELDRVVEQRDQLLAALDEAKAGLLWYRAEFPDVVNDCDHEAMGRIDAAIAGCQS